MSFNVIQSERTLTGEYANDRYLLLDSITLAELKMEARRQGRGAHLENYPFMYLANTAKGYIKLYSARDYSISS